MVVRTCKSGYCDKATTSLPCNFATTQYVFIGSTKPVIRIHLENLNPLLVCNYEMEIKVIVFGVEDD